MSAKPPPSVAVMKLTKAQYQDMRAWMNRALLAESRLAVLRTAYEPQELDTTK